MFFSEHSVYDAERELLAIAKFLVHDLSAFVSDVVQFLFGILLSHAITCSHVREKRCF